MNPKFHLSIRIFENGVHSCVADLCATLPATGDGYGSQCDSLVTDGSCTQSCTAEYTNIGGDGVMNCDNGVLGGQQIDCKANCDVTATILSANAVLGGNTVMDHGTNSSYQCDEAGYTGTLSVSCNDGTAYVFDGECMGNTCDTEYCVMMMMLDNRAFLVLLLISSCLVRMKHSLFLFLKCASELICLHTVLF